MPLKQVCSHPGCTSAIDYRERWCIRHREAGLEHLAEMKRRRQRTAPVSPEKRAASRLYGTAAWHRIRLAQLQAEPLCRHCGAEGRVTAATVVDHEQPHWNDKQVFYDRTNLQSLCKRHHDIKTAGEDAAKRRARDVGDM